MNPESQHIPKTQKLKDYMIEPLLLSGSKVDSKKRNWLSNQINMLENQLDPKELSHVRKEFNEYIKYLETGGEEIS